MFQSCFVATLVERWFVVAVRVFFFYNTAKSVCVCVCIRSNGKPKKTAKLERNVPADGLTFCSFTYAHVAQEGCAVPVPRKSEKKSPARPIPALAAPCEVLVVLSWSVVSSCVVVELVVVVRRQVVPRVALVVRRNSQLGRRLSSLAWPCALSVRS